MTERKLTPKQAAFVREYLIDLNATQAYMRAGYSSKPASARVQSCRMLADPNIADAIGLAMEQRAARVDLTADRVLQELSRIAFADVRKLYRSAEDGGGMLLPCELDDDTAAALVGVDVVEELEQKDGDNGRELVGYTKKVKMADKVQALALAMRHLGILNDKLDVKVTQSLAERMRKRAQG